MPSEIFILSQATKHFVTIYTVGRVALSVSCEWRIETIRFKTISRLQVTFGLDTADYHCLLDQRSVYKQIVR